MQTRGSIFLAIYPLKTPDEIFRLRVDNGEDDDDDDDDDDDGDDDSDDDQH